MESEYWVGQLGRLYGEIERHDMEATGGSAFAEQYNKILGKLQEEFPDNEVVQSMEKADTVGRRDMFGSSEVKAVIKMNCGQLADALGYELPTGELEKTARKESMGIVLVQNQENTQKVSQDVSQEITIDATLEMINYLPYENSIKKDLRQIVEEFDNELGEEDPDESRLRNLVEDAAEKSTEVAVNLAMKGLEKSLIGVLGL